MKIMNIQSNDPDFKTHTALLKNDLNQLQEPKQSKAEFNEKVSAIMQRELDFYAASKQPNSSEILPWLQNLATIAILTKDEQTKLKYLQIIQPIFIKEMGDIPLAKSAESDAILGAYISLKCLCLAKNPVLIDKLKELEKSSENTASLLQKIRDDSELQNFIKGSGDTILKKYFLMDEDLEIMETISKIKDQVENQESILHYLAKTDLKITSDLLKEIISKYKLQINAKNTEGETALQLARELGNEQMLSALLANGASEEG